MSLDMNKIILLILSVFILNSSYARAQDSFGLAMHGDPKYTAEDTHLDYANPDAPKGGKITHSAIGTFDTINPYSIKGKPAKGLNLVYDRLMQRVWDEPFTMYPLIAERIDVADDRSNMTVYVNPDAVFHDASPITADDVIFSFETLKTEGRPNMRQIYKLVKTIEKRDDHTVYIEFGEGFDQETMMIIAMMPVLSKTYWSDKTFDSTTLDTPLLNGPYSIKSIDPGRQIVYERKKDYWAKDLLPNVGHFNFDEIVYDYYRDDGVALEAFKAGEVDLRREYDAGKWSSRYDFPAAKGQGKNESVRLEALPHGRPEKVQSFIFNTRRPPFDDIRVRQALSLAFDFEWVNKNLFHGQYKQIDSFFPNSELASPLKEEKSTNVRQNLRKAANLLKEAGWEVKNGKRMKDGEEFAFEIMLSAPEEEKIALHYQRSLQRLGINARIRVLDAAAFIGRLNEYDYDMVLYHWLSSLSPGTEQPLYWSCAAAEQPARWNFAGICDERIDELASSIASSKTREELVKKIHELDQRLLEGHYMVPLYYSGVDYVAYWDHIKRPEETPLYGMVLETWWAENK